MTAETQSVATAPQSGLGLRIALSSGVVALPLARVHHLAGYASLEGTAEDYFLGWLRLRDAWVPVFDLNRVLCDEPTPERFGTRIVIVTARHAPVLYIGLLANGVTDTMPVGDARLDLDGFLPMLYTMIPAAPGAA
jgi:chemotaxis signal transduction protein